MNDKTYNYWYMLKIGIPVEMLDEMKETSREQEKSDDETFHTEGEF